MSVKVNLLMKNIFCCDFYSIFFEKNVSIRQKIGLHVIKYLIGERINWRKNFEALWKIV